MARIVANSVTYMQNGDAELRWNSRKCLLYRLALSVLNEMGNSPQILGAHGFSVKGTPSTMIEFNPI